MRKNTVIATVLIVVGVSAAAGYFATSGGPQPSAAYVPTVSPSNAPAVVLPTPAVNPEGNPYPNAKPVSITLKDDKLVAGPAVVQMRLGDVVVFEITDNKKGEAFVVERYGINAEIDTSDASPGGAMHGRAYLAADHAGTFAFGIDDPRVTLGTIEVTE